MKKISVMILGVILCACSKEDNAEVQQESVAKNELKVTSTTVGNVSRVGASAIAGVNWADGRDNYVDGWVMPSGLTASDSYNTVAAKTESIINGFSSKVYGVNTIRIPINPPSVADSWWNSYQAVIDKTTAKRFKVIVACWEADNSKDGKIDNVPAFWNMWTTVINKYKGNESVYFEPFNEPHGYTLEQLTNIYAQFLSRFPDVPKERIILDGKGYSEDVTGVGADTRFDGCLLGLHNYAFWTTRSVDQWRADWRRRIGIYGSRTVVTEFGSAMKHHETGYKKDYQNGNQTDNEIAYIVATSDICRDDKIGSVYWPGLRDGDSYSLLTRDANGTNIGLYTVNYSGVFRLRYGWGENF